MNIEQDDVTDEFLMHFGKKGMKWGVRNQVKLERLQRVGSGGGSLLDKYSVASKTNTISLIRNKGLAGSARAQAGKAEASKARIESGQAKFRDVLRVAGNKSVLDVVYTDRKGGNQARKKKVASLTSLLDLTN